MLSDRKQSQIDKLAEGWLGGVARLCNAEPVSGSLPAGPPVSPGLVEVSAILLFSGCPSASRRP